MIDRLFAWLSDRLGITDNRKQSEWQYRQLEEKLQEIQSQLNAIQIDKLKVYVQKQADKPKIADLMRVMVMDLDTEQLAALEDFKDEK